MDSIEYSAMRAAISDRLGHGGAVTRRGSPLERAGALLQVRRARLGVVTLASGARVLLPLVVTASALDGALPGNDCQHHRSSPVHRYTPRHVST